jgi:hypothetical protein
MQKLFLAFLVVSLLPAFVLAQQSGQPATKPEKSSTLRPAKSNPCAHYGAGFVQVGNTTTCIKIGGGVTFEGGGGARSR